MGPFYKGDINVQSEWQAGSLNSGSRTHNLKHYTLVPVNQRMRVGQLLGSLLSHRFC